MAKKRRKKRRKGKGPGPSPNQGGGVMQGMVRGFRRAAGAEAPKKKESLLSQLFTIALFAAAAAMVVYQCSR